MLVGIVVVTRINTNSSNYQPCSGEDNIFTCACHSVCIKACTWAGGSLGGGGGLPRHPLSPLPTLQKIAT